MDLLFTYGLFEQTVRAVELVIQQMVKAEGGEVHQNSLSRRGEEKPYRRATHSEKKPEVYAKSK